MYRCMFYFEEQISCFKGLSNGNSTVTEFCRDFEMYSKQKTMTTFEEFTQLKKKKLLEKPCRCNFW